MKRVLIAVCGATPQVITETLFALHVEGRMVDAVRILTTRLGKEKCNAHLLSPKDGAYYRFIEEYGLDPTKVDFGPFSVKVVTDDNGNEIEDIADEEENELFLHACMETAFEWTRDPDTAVYFSIAGGRKSMGACLSLAAQLYGRPQDRILHVLVTPEFENCPDFFYPPREPRPVTLRNGKGQTYTMDSSCAEVTLLNVPFFSLRDRLSPALLKGPQEPATLMLSLVRERRPELVVNLPERKLVWKGVEMDMKPAWLALYAFFARVKKDQSCDRSNCRGCERCFMTWQDLEERQDEIASIYRAMRPPLDEDEKPRDGVRNLDLGNFNSYKSRIRKALERHFGSAGLKHLEIVSRGRNPARYGIVIDRERIRIVI